MVKDACTTLLVNYISNPHGKMMPLTELSNCLCPITIITSGNIETIKRMEKVFTNIITVLYMRALSWTTDNKANVRSILPTEIGTRVECAMEGLKATGNTIIRETISFMRDTGAMESKMEMEYIHIKGNYELREI